MNRLKNLIRLLSILAVLSVGILQASAGRTGTSAGQLTALDEPGLINFRFGGHTGGQLGPLAVKGGYAYVGVGPILAVLDVSDPANIQRIGSILVGQVNDIALADGKAYLATESGLQVVSLSDPAAPRLVGASESFYAVKVAVQSNYVFLIEQEWSDAAPRLRIYSAADPYSPVLVGTYTFFSDPKFWLFMHMSGLQVSGNYAYLTYGGLVYSTAAGSLVAIDVSDRANPQLAGELQMSGISDLKVIGSTAYLTTWSASSIPNSSTGSLVTVYLADPAHLQVRGSYTAECYPDGVCPSLDKLVVAGSYAYVKSDVLRVLDISNPANPFLVDKIPANGEYIFLDSDSVYLTGPEGLQAFSLAVPAAPALAGDYHPLFRNAFDVAVSDYDAYLAANDGLHILNPNPPWDMVQLAHATVSGQKLALRGNILYLANQYGLQVVDVTIPSQPKGVSGFSAGSSFNLSDFDVQRNYAYLEMGDGLYVVDVSDPAHPRQTAQLPFTGRSTYHVALNGNVAYRASGDLQVLDISDLGNPVLIAQHDLLLPASDIAVQGRYLYILQNDGLTVLDMLNPASPVELGIFPLPGTAFSITLSVHFAFVSTLYAGLRVVDLTNPAQLQEAGNADLPFGWTSVIYDHVYLAGNGLYVLQFARYKIQGWISTWDGKPSAGVVIDTNIGISLTTSSDGSYLLPHLYTDGYTLTPRSQEYAFYPSYCHPDLPDAICNFTALSLPVMAAFQPGVATQLVYTGTQALPTSLDFPAGAFAQPTSLVLTPTLASSGAGLAFTGHAFELSAQDNQGPLVEFSLPVTLTIAYSDFDIRFVTDESKLALYRWDGGGWAEASSSCTPAAVYDRSLSTGRISLSICKTGKYALYGPSHLTLYPVILRQNR